MTGFLKTLLVLLPAWPLVAGVVLTGDVGIVDHQTHSMLQVRVNGQVAERLVQDRFVREFEPDWGVARYLCGLPSAAAVTGLRIWTAGQWTDFAPAVLDPADAGWMESLPDGVQSDLRELLGPAWVAIGLDGLVQTGDSFTVELRTVEWLPASFGGVGLEASLENPLFENWYFGPLDSLQFDLRIDSPQGLDELVLVDGPPGAVVESGPWGGSVVWTLRDSVPHGRFQVEYQLAQEGMGLVALSTRLPDSLVADGGSPGFLLFAAQPDPAQQTEAIDKAFTLMIDRSTSMVGAKLQQAKSAASTIVSLLEDGELFGLVDFADSARCFQQGLVAISDSVRSAALEYIDDLRVSGHTNMGAAFERALPFYAQADSGQANLLVFLTDGLPSAGITDPDALRAHVDSLFGALGAPVHLNCFGIGPDVDRQLLTTLADVHGGVADFLEDDDVEEGLLRFYRRVRYPVLLDPWIEFAPAALEQVTPVALPDLHIGQQLVVCGRYDQAGPLLIELGGRAFDAELSYLFETTLAEAALPDRAFLPKIWAAKTIERMLVEWELAGPGSPEADEIQDRIVELSLQWGVLSPFTGFDVVAVDEGPDADAARPGSPLLLAAYPNPFNPATRLRIEAPAGTRPGLASLRVYNLTGQLVRELRLAVGGAGVWEIVWDGRDGAGRELASGVYVVVAELGERLVSLKVTLVR